MPKLKNRLLATLLALTTIVTSINLPQFTSIIYAADQPQIYDGVSISTDADTWEVIDFAATNSTAKLAGYIQTIRVTLMRTTDTEGNPVGGMPATSDQIPKLITNPIHMVPYDYTWAGDIENHVYAPSNSDPKRVYRGLSVFNSRREYLADNLHSTDPSYPPNSYVLSYATKWKPDDPSNKNSTAGHWEFNDSKFQSRQIAKTIFPDRCIPNPISGIGADKKAYYQEHPPTPEVASATTTAEYLDAISKAVFVDTEYGQTEAKQVLIYHIIADMIGKKSDPYCQDVEDIVKLVLNNEYEILLEPTISFYGGSDTIRGMFGLANTSDIITLTAGDAAMCEDIISTVWAGATSKQSSYKKTAEVNDQKYVGGNRHRGYNPLTHSPENGANMFALYKSLQLKETDKRVNLHAVTDKNYYGAGGYIQGLLSGANKWTDAAGNSNVKWGPLSNGQPGALVESPLYQQIANTITHNGGNPAGTNVSLDIASQVNTGAMYIIKPQFSSVNYTVTAKGYGEPTYKTTPTGQKLPVYKEAFDAVTNQIIVNVQTRLKMDSEITDPASPVKGTKWVDEVLVAEPTNYNTELPRTNGDGAYKVQSITSDMTKVYIPGITRSNLTLYYADENGNPLESYTQINGTPGNRNSSIITKDESTGQYYKLFLDNVNYYAFNPQTNEPDTYQLSVSNCVDTNKMGDANIATASNVFSDSKSGETNWLDITIPSIEKRPTNAAYILVKSTVNMGATLKHKTTDSLSSEQVAQSRPQQHLDSAGNLVNEYALASRQSSQ